MKNHKLYALIIAALLSGCNSGGGDASPHAGPSHPVNPPIKPEPPSTQDIPMLPLEPSKPITPEKPEPPKPTLPIFISEGIATHAQSPYSGTVTRGGEDYLRYNATVNGEPVIDFQDFELPTWAVAYKYEPYLEVLLTNGFETICTRYSWKLDGFGYARPHCLWSDTRNAVPLEDMHNAYYGYSVVETRVWLSGVVGLCVGVSM